jgi:mycothiol maleylpyruvate isomerase-like protein
VDSTAEPYRRVAAGFSRRVQEVPPRAWDNPAPYEGWLTRDVVRHLVEWMPSLFLAGAGIDLPVIPPVDVDPAGAWQALDRALQAGLDETLDPDEVHTLFVGMEPMDAVLRESGHYGPRVEVRADADEQTKLIAFTGRHP